MSPFSFLFMGTSISLAGRSTVNSKYDFRTVTLQRWTHRCTSTVNVDTAVVNDADGGYED